MRLPDGAPFQTTRDHSKWGVHVTEPLVVIGDLNRTQTQAKRGGGQGASAPPETEITFF